MNSHIQSGRSAFQVAALHGSHESGLVVVRPVTVWQSQSTTYSPLATLSGLSVVLRRASAALIRGENPQHAAFINSITEWSGGSVPRSTPYQVRVRVSSQLDRLREFVCKRRIGPSDINWSSPGEDAVGFVASSAFAPRWLCRGERVSMHGHYSAVRLSEAAGPILYTRGPSRLPIVAIPTVAGDVVVIDPEPRRFMGDPKLCLMTESVHLMNSYNAAHRHGWSIAGRYAGVIVPMIAHTARWHHDEIVGASARGARAATVRLAYEEIHFSLSDHGGPSTFAKHSGRSGDYFVVDRPFLVTIIRPGVQLPIMAGWYDASCWLR